MIGNTDDINNMILTNLLHNSEYFIKVFHHLDSSYFPEGSAYKDLFLVIKKFYERYEGKPTKMAINIDLNSAGLPEDRYNNTRILLNSLTEIKGEDVDIMVKQTEKHVKDVAFYNTLEEAVAIYQNNKLPEETRNKRMPSLESTQDLFAKTLAISFENNLGHDYNKGFEERLKSYLEGVYKIPFRLQSMNTMTNGGVGKKTLNIPIAPTGVGKSMFLCSLASDYMLDGLDVLYITLEMSEFEVSKRIDANILDISLSQLERDTINSDLYTTKAKAFMERPSMGQIRVKNYASREATVNDFSALIDDYRIKENFIPDIVIVDYLMIVKSTGRNEKPHESYNRIAVELRALAFKHDVAVWSPMQTNRDGVDKGDLSLSDIAGSFDVSHHADFIIMIIESDDGVDRRTQKIKTVKNRYGSKDENNYVELFVTKGKQRYEDMDEFNSSPPNTPPRMAYAKPMSIGTDGTLEYGKEVEEKKPERELSFDTGEKSIDEQLAGLTW